MVVPAPLDLREARDEPSRRSRGLISDLHWLCRPHGLDQALVRTLDRRGRVGVRRLFSTGTSVGGSLWMNFSRLCSECSRLLLHAFEKNAGATPASDARKAQARMADFQVRMDARSRRPPRAAGRDAPSSSRST